MIAPGRLAAFLRCACDTARLMVGQPSYDTYVDHMKRTHPATPPMTPAEFFRDRQDARFGGGGRFTCC